MPQTQTPADPIWELVGPGKQIELAWLARKTGYAYHSVWSIRSGRLRATPRFRAACALAIGVAEDELFAPEPMPTIDRPLATA